MSDTESHQMKQVIYVALLDESVACWRPVDAIHKQDDIYTIISKNPNLEDERWEFLCGANVRCRSHTFSGGSTGLRAYAKAS